MPCSARACLMPQCRLLSGFGILWPGERLGTGGWVLLSGEGSGVTLGSEVTPPGSGFVCRPTLFACEGPGGMAGCPSVTRRLRPASHEVTALPCPPQGRNQTGPTHPGPRQGGRSRAAAAEAQPSLVALGVM